MDVAGAVPRVWKLWHRDFIVANGLSADVVIES
jgi:hypothetical protein